MSIENFNDTLSDVKYVDVRRKKKIFVSLQDKDGDVVEFKEVIDNLNRYITDQLEREEMNPLRDEISPLITQIFMGSLVYAAGHPATAAFIASQETLRYSITHQMMLSFYFVKFVQKNELKIVTKEEDVTEEEIERIRRVSAANSVATMGAMMGMDPKEILRELHKSGQLHKEDVEGIFGEEDELSEDESKDTKPKPGSN